MSGLWPDWLADKAFRRAFEKAKIAARGTPLDAYYRADVPALQSDLDALPLVALDFETDGLARTAQILEAGWVGLSGGAVQLASAGQIRVRATSRLQESAVVIHQITDDAAAHGVPEADMLANLVAALAGKPVVAHAAQIERHFLNAACQRCFGAPFVGRFICTMALEQRWFDRPRAPDGLRLGKLRAGYGLPAYRAHDGLTDAIACAELLLAQLARRRSAGLVLGDVLLRD